MDTKTLVVANVFTFYGSTFKIPETSVDGTVKFVSIRSTEPIKRHPTEKQDFLDHLINTNIKVFLSANATTKKSIIDTFEHFNCRHIQTPEFQDRLIFQYQF